MCDCGNLYVRIRGADMKLEIWGLMRLFADESRIVFLDDESIPEPPTGSRLITLTLTGDAPVRSVEACLYEGINDISSLENAINRLKAPDIRYQKDIGSDNSLLPGRSILNNIKINCGTSVYSVLSKAYRKKLPYGSLLGVRPVKLASGCLQEGMDEGQTIELLQEATGMSGEKARLLVSVASYERLYEDGDDRAVNLYVGVPFCAGRCLYCSFTAYPIDRMKNIVKHYVDALIRELESGRAIIERYGLKINAVYMGGGTPTALPEEEFKRLLYTVRDFFPGAREFTVEAGRPDTINREKLIIIRESGAGRISINPQTMNAETLRIIGRNHTPEEIINKFNLARELGFDNINMDIIAGLPGETSEMFNNTLTQVEAMNPDSLTVHTMAYKRASRLAAEKESYPAADDDTVEKMTESARISASRMGMAPYYLYRQKNILANLENTGYAKTGKACIYNIRTMTEKQSIIAFGAGAISKFVGLNGQLINRDDNVKDVAQYIARIDEMIARKIKLFANMG